MSRLVRGVVAVVLVAGVVVWFGSYQRYRDPVNGFNLSYPRTWFVQELKDDAATAPGVYFSAQKTDFNDPYALQTPDFVRVSVRPASEWVEKPENKGRTFTDAKGLNDVVWEEQQAQAPHIPGPPRFKSYAQGFTVPGAIEVSSIQTAYYGPNAYHYWILYKNRLYEILVSSTDSSRNQRILASFKFI